jgi:hypothetical protein
MTLDTAMTGEHLAQIMTVWNQFVNWQHNRCGVHVAVVF